MAATTPATTSRGRATRERILVAATDLVADRGFHAVGVSDIGAAAGVTGAALYRHFDTKHAILVAMFERVIDGLIDGARRITTEGQGGLPALVALVAAHVDFALGDRPTLAVYARESHNLPADDRRRLRRKQRQYVDMWVGVLHLAEPTLSSTRLVTRVEAVFGLLNSAPNLAASIPDRQIAPELRVMALAALTCPVGVGATEATGPVLSDGP